MGVNVKEAGYLGKGGGILTRLWRRSQPGSNDLDRYWFGGVNHFRPIVREGLTGAC